MNYFIGGSGVATVLDGKEKYFTSHSLLDSSVDVTSSMEEAVGQNGTLIGQFYHSTRMKVTLSDQLFDLKYVAMNLGTAIEMGTSVTTRETITLGAGGTGAVAGIPVPYGSFGSIGWANKEGSDTQQSITFTGKTFNFTGGQTDDVVCVEYYVDSPATEFVTIPAVIDPKIYTLILKANLYVSYSNEFSTNTASIVGEVIITIPQFLLEGNLNISMTNTGISNTPLTGQAKAYGGASCNGELSLGTIAVNIRNANWYDKVERLALKPAVDSIAVAETTLVSVKGVGVGMYPNIPPTSDLTFTSEDVAKATVSNAGLITGVAVGTTNIIVTVTAKPEVQGVTSITVTA